MKTIPAPIRIANFHANSLKEQFTALLELVKIRISLLVTSSMMAGYIWTAGQIRMETLLAAAAVLFLSCGSCALNQYQERKIDELMDRTKSRPLPSQRLKPAMALWMALSLIFSGSLILLCSTGLVPLALGLFTVLWYNGVYTHLKQKTAFASIPGALIGAIPPVIGWVSGGGSLVDPQIWILSCFFFIWQVPHFWLLLLDFAVDYEKAGLPSLTRRFSMEQLKRIIFIWMGSTLVSCLSIPLFGFVSFSLTYLFLLTLTFWLLWNAISFFRSSPRDASFGFVFTKLNIYAFLVLFLLSLDKLLASAHMKLSLIKKMLAIVG